MRLLINTIFLASLIGCGDKEEDTGTADTSVDTAAEDTAAEDTAMGEE